MICLGEHGVRNGTVNYWAAERGENYRRAVLRPLSQPGQRSRSERATMKDLNFSTSNETRHDEQDRSRMNDEGCPNDPVLSAPTKTGIDGACETLGKILDHPESLALGAGVPQSLLDLINVVRFRLSMEIDERAGLANEGDLISSMSRRRVGLVLWRCRERRSVHIRLTNHRGVRFRRRKRQVKHDINGCNFSISSSARRI